MRREPNARGPITNGNMDRIDGYGAGGDVGMYNWNIKRTVDRSPPSVIVLFNCGYDVIRTSLRWIVRLEDRDAVRLESRTLPS